ncbi:hypothetical protein [Streptacidiphilus neutrinimicus]|uniref:hypothetical protein n=1 Tax=Streptacidiphilus neutrinimicus TaxID=105420 RepID=UPI0005A76383|nr:hypothetical protein [Streptacidiphilus neutrinimicus]
MNEGGGILEQGPEGRWGLYGWERGTASLVRSFDDEDQACRFFYDRLTRSVPEPVELAPEQRADLVARARRQQAERLREREE